MNATTHDGRRALVTGAAQGIGHAIALALAERGARVIATTSNYRLKLQIKSAQQLMRFKMMLQKRMMGTLYF